MNLLSLAKVPLKVLPSCEYVLVGTDKATTPTAFADQYDARGQHIGFANTQSDTIKGTMTKVGRGTINLLPEGMSADASFVLYSERELDMPALPSADVRERWLVQDKAGDWYRLMTKGQVGCVFRYFCELYAEPPC